MFNVSASLFLLSGTLLMQSKILGLPLVGMADRFSPDCHCGPAGGSTG